MPHRLDLGGTNVAIIGRADSAAAAKPSMKSAGAATTPARVAASAPAPTTGPTATAVEGAAAVRSTPPPTPVSKPAPAPVAVTAPVSTITPAPPAPAAPEGTPASPDTDTAPATDAGAAPERGGKTTGKDGAAAEAPPSGHGHPPVSVAADGDAPAPDEPAAVPPAGTGNPFLDVLAGVGSYLATGTLSDTLHDIQPEWLDQTTGNAADMVEIVEQVASGDKDYATGIGEFLVQNHQTRGAVGLVDAIVGTGAAAIALTPVVFIPEAVGDVVQLLTDPDAYHEEKDAEAAVWGGIVGGFADHVGTAASMGWNLIVDRDRFEEQVAEQVAQVYPSYVAADGDMFATTINVLREDPVTAPFVEPMVEKFEDGKLFEMMGAGAFDLMSLVAAPLVKVPAEVGKVVKVAGYVSDANEFERAHRQS